VRSAGSFFFPLDVRLGLGTEGYSPAVLAKAIRQASKASSFAEARDDLRELAEVHRRGLDRAKRKACVCDGQAYNWSIYEMHLLPAGFVAILDVVHLLAYLYDAAHALGGSDAARGWKTYAQWLRWAWSGKISLLLTSLRAAAAELAAKGSAAAPRSNRRSSRSTAESKAPRNSGWRRAPKRSCNCVRPN
jgi:hypothetical protein